MKTRRKLLPGQTSSIPPNKRMPIRVGVTENALKKQIKAAGARWNPMGTYHGEIKGEERRC